MFLNRTVEIDGNRLNEFKYSTPLGERYGGSSDSELLAYFHEDSMDLDRLIVRANSLNISNPINLYATQPVTATTFKADDMEFKGVNCKKASESEQEKLNQYVNRIVEIILKTNWTRYYNY